MAGVAVFFEASPDIRPVELQIVRLTIGHLMKTGIRFWPYASNLHEFRDVMLALKGRGTAPVLYVVNTLGTDETLPTLDLLMGETPVLFFRRELAWLQSGGVPESERTHFSTIFQKMTPRLTAVWRYGKANSSDIALQAARRIEVYLRDQNFRSLEGQVM